MKKKLFLSALAMCAFMFSMTAQNAPTATTTAKAAPVKKEMKETKKAKMTDASVASTDATPKAKKPIQTKTPTKMNSRIRTTVATMPPMRASDIGFLGGRGVGVMGFPCWYWGR